MAVMDELAVKAATYLIEYCDTNDICSGCVFNTPGKCLLAMINWDEPKIRSLGEENKNDREETD